MLSVAAAFSTSAVQVTSVAPESFTELGWSRSGPSKPTDKVEFTLNLKARNMAELKRRALAASTPGTPEYGKFMTTAEIDALTSPSPDAVNRVKSWLADSGIEHRVVRENIFVHTSVEKASQLLGTSFSTYRMDGRALTKAGNFSLPAEVAEVTATTLGLHGMPAPRHNPIPMVKANGANPPAVTPSVIAATYNIKNPYVNPQGKNLQGVAEFQGQYMNKNDLVEFFEKEVPGFTSGEDDVTKFVGAPYKQGNGVEADLDIQFIMGNAPGVKTDFFEWPEYATSLSPLPSPLTLLHPHSPTPKPTTPFRHTWTGLVLTRIPRTTKRGRMDFCSDLLSYTSALLDSDSIVNSISYGFQGNLQQLNCKTSDVTAVDNNWAKLAAKGVSVMISSGDSGSGYTRSGLGGYKLYPSWPASSPWVTAVGATCFIDQTVGNGEMASSQFGSGGGFSTMFDQSDAKWQQKAVAAYVAKGSSLPKFPAASKFDATGRATPDVSALGEGFQVYVNGRVEPVGGTSASSPTFAAMISLINEERFKANKPVRRPPPCKPHTRLTPLTHAHTHTYTPLPTPAPPPPSLLTPVRPCVRTKPTGDGLP